MSHSDSIKVLFDLQDPNLHFLEDDIQKIQKNRFMNGETHKILNIVENRKLYALEDYFSRFSYPVRCQVEYIVMDMYSPYIQLGKHFENTENTFKII
ncbi:hypothetical protein FUSO5_09015 [Fusobacterium necrophorum BFTR-1]|uniref:transposase n=1 Tax=Fusobacterium necrophorum TaxID=859 RepID=UPI000460DE52|nr:transposase [Fusobacterium necrophorum]KDE62782.1 hypothetical protein FUSO5_09015 [Fusobacterium necrophorum BFTR-1]MBR8823881.1 hypothetical protein [Fusobacterium necrophorum]MCF0162870.1 transposase [Fusobacterium necrophorum]